MRFTHTYALLGSVAFAASASAGVLVEDFADFPGMGLYGGNWQQQADTDNYRVTGNGWGGGFYDIEPNVDAGANRTAELTINLHSYETPAQPDAGLGIVLGIAAENGSGGVSEYFPSQYGVLPGEQVLSFEMPEYIDVAGLSFFHLQIDPGTNANDVYDISFVSLEFTPEPGSAALLCLAGGLLARRRLA